MFLIKVKYIMLWVSLWAIWAKAVDKRVKLMPEGATKGFEFICIRIWDTERINNNNQTKVSIKKINQQARIVRKILI